MKMVTFAIIVSALVLVLRQSTTAAQSASALWFLRKMSAHRTFLCVWVSASNSDVQQ
jgi:hypothetical protein